MLYRILDLLACPNCKHHPLELIVIEEDEVGREINHPKPLCTYYCGYLRKKVVKEGSYPCEECVGKEIKLGILLCPNCGMWYPISNGIPIMFSSKKDRERVIGRFIQQYGDRIPKDVWEKIKAIKNDS